MTTTDTTPAAIAAMLDGVTPGASPNKWRVESRYSFISHKDTWQVVLDVPNSMALSLVADTGGNFASDKANARFIAATRQLVPALAAERDRLAAEVERLRAQLAATVPQDSAWQPETVAVRVKPLVWEVDHHGRRYHHEATRAECPILGQVCADRPTDQADVEARRAARILATIEAAPAAAVRDAALEEAAMKLDAMARTKTYTDEDLGETTGRNLIDPRKAAAAIRAMKGGAK